MLKCSRKPDIYMFHVNSKTLLLDVGTSSSFEIDGITSDVLDLCGTKNASQIIEILSKQYAKDEVIEVLTELEELEKLGMLFPHDGAKKPPRYRSPLSELSLHAIHDCSLRCKYCFAQSGANYTGKERVMSEHIARQALDFMIAEFGKDALSYRVDFISGGEPLLNFDLFKAMKGYGKEQEKRTQRKINFWLCTNATLLNDEIIEYLNEEDQAIGISIDGPKPVHDSMRCFPDGRGSYDVVRSWADRIMHSKEITGELKRLWPLVVLHDKTGSLVEVLKHHAALGFSTIQIKPVRSTKDKPYAITEENIGRIKRTYDELAEFLLETALAGDLRYFKMILNKIDYLGRYTCRLLLHDRLRYRCGAGKSKISVAADGDFYPCDSFVGMREFKMGNVGTGWDRSIREMFMKCSIFDKEDCRSCWVRYLCGGGCYYSAYINHGRIDKPDQVICQLVQHLIRLGMTMISELQEKNPPLLKRLHNYVLNRRRLDTVRMAS